MRLLKEVGSLMGNYHVKSGIYHYHRNEFKQAADFLRKALRDEENLTEGDRRIARFYLTETFVSSAEKQIEKEDLEAAARDYARAAEVSPEYPDIRCRLGQVLERLKRHEEATQEYRLALACNESYLEARVALAFCLLHAGKEEEAAEALQQALDLKLQIIREPYDKGLRRLQEGMMEEAEASLREAFLSAPDRFADHFRAAMSALKAEDYESALEEIDKSLDLNPKFVDLHNYRGITLCELDRVSEAIGAFRRAATLNPEYVEARLNLAFAHLRAGQFKEAEAQLEAVLEQDPGQAVALLKLQELRTGRAAESRRAGPRGGAR